jgi:hypothetical protein
VTNQQQPTRAALQNRMHIYQQFNFDLNIPKQLFMIYVFKFSKLQGSFVCSKIYIDKNKIFIMSNFSLFLFKFPNTNKILSKVFILEFFSPNNPTIRHTQLTQKFLFASNLLHLKSKTPRFQHNQRLIQTRSKADFNFVIVHQEAIVFQDASR